MKWVEVTVQEYGQPAQVKIEKNSKGYNIEVSLHAETIEQAETQTVASMQRIRAALGDVPDGRA